MADLFLIYSNEHRAWWGPGRMGYTTDTDRAGRYSEAEATEIVLNANRYRKMDVPPNEVMVLAPPPRAMLMTDEEVLAAALSDPDNLPLTPADFARMKPRRPPTKDMSDAEIERAVNRAFARYDDMPRIVCTEAHPWDGTPLAGTMILHPDARTEDGVRRCPNCNYIWEKDDEQS